MELSGGVGGAGGHAVAVAVRLVAQIGAAAHPLGVPVAGPPGSARGRSAWSVAHQSAAGPSGARHEAPSTPHHHGVPSGRGAAGRNPANAYDQPNRSASVTCPVSRTKRANRSLVTACTSMRNAATATSRTGPSPSAGKPSASSAPIRNVPPGSSAMSVSWPPVCAVAAGAGAVAPPRDGVQQLVGRAWTRSTRNSPGPARRWRARRPAGTLPAVRAGYFTGNRSRTRHVPRPPPAPSWAPPHVTCYSCWLTLHHGDISRRGSRNAIMLT